MINEKALEAALYAAQNCFATDCDDRIAIRAAINAYFDAVEEESRAIWNTLPKTVRRE